MKAITTWRLGLPERERWDAGPWDFEPDKLQWLDEASGLPCVRSPMGVWCGYVGVPRSHPAYGVDYQEVELEVHGGLTFSNRRMEDGGHVCHVVEAGEDDDVWWLGFDCGHAFDLIPRHLALFAELAERDPQLAKLQKFIDAGPEWMQDSYKPLSYARAETLRLAEQLA